MLWILGIIVVLYVSSYLIWRNNPTFLKIRKWVDVTTLVVTSVLVIAWIEVFHYSFYFVIYFIISLAFIVYLVLYLRKIEEKKKRAEKTIQMLKDKEELLEEENKELKSKTP